MHVSLITSLYRGEAYLPTYGQHVKRFLAYTEQAGLDVEILVIANDPTPTERTLLADLPVRVIETARETLYASWNRGIAAMTSDIFAPWNVDDERDGAALVEGYALMQQGYTLVDMPMRVVQTLPGLIPRQRRFVRAPSIHESQFTRKHGLTAFVLIHRCLFTEVGLFDPHFRIMGDMEWAGRAQALAKIAVSQREGGTFYLHGGNLSGTNNPREMMEFNIIFLRRQQWDEIRPTPDPTAMREMWETWGNPSGHTLPLEIEAMLWGTNALQTWETWYAAHQRRQRRLIWSRRIHAVTDWLGLSPILRRLRR
jgi:hypothetical protein